MKAGVLALLINPRTHSPLHFEGDGLVDYTSGERFAFRSGIPVFLNEADISDRNGKYQRLYDSIAPFYDISQKIYYRLRRGGDKHARMEYLRELEIKEGDRVLEVSVGTGANICFLPRTAEYFGLDISWAMLDRCRKNTRRRGREVTLFQGAAERLPFADEAFDAVFHVGGINFFNDRTRAVQEMVRVAKPGTKIMIADETEEMAGNRSKVPVSGRFYADRRETIPAPVELLPDDMLDVQVKTIGRGGLFVLTFRKPE